MRIKKFTASSYAEALNQVKREMGEHALIISTRSLRKDSRAERVDNSTLVEITASIDHSAVEDTETKNSRFTEKECLRFIGNDDIDIKSLMFSMFTQSDRARALGVEPHQLGLFTQLVENGIHERLVPKLIQRINEDEGETDSSLQSGGRIIKLMKQVLGCAGGIRLDGEGVKKVALVGPTGAGKTTTIAKLAADVVYRQRKKVALISLDTYRLGAIDQLRIYGEIMEVPVETAADKQDFQSKLNHHADKDIILVDTTGRCHTDNTYAGFLKRTFEAAGGVETHLVLPTSAHENQFNAAWKQYSPLEVDRVLFTKLDEGLSFGPLFNFSLRSRIPFSYFTTGQKVPEDIEVASQERVIRLIFN